jgi:hypothetical protein
LTIFEKSLIIVSMKDTLLAFWTVYCLCMMPVACARAQGDFMENIIVTFLVTWVLIALPWGIWGKD